MGVLVLVQVGALEDELAVEVLDQGPMEQPVVLGMRHHESRRQVVGHEDEHAALSFVDLEDPQLDQAAFFGALQRVRRAAEGEQVGDHLALVEEGPGVEPPVVAVDVGV